MSFFQPLITTAFSNYGLLRSSYAYRDSEISVGNVAGKRVDDSNKINEKSTSQKVNSVNDPDAGKIKSAFGDILDISEEGKAAYESISKSKDTNSKDTSIKVADSSQKTSETKENSENKAKDKTKELDDENKLTKEEQEQQQIKELKERDTEVRQHEAAHLAVAGQYAQGGAEYTYQTGPDGKKYAIGGSVSIDVSEVAGNPEATIAKMQQVAAAATAPAEPSAQDLKVAASARRTEAKAKIELAQNNSEKINEQNNKSENSDNSEKSEISENNNTISQSTQADANKNSKQNITDKILKSVISSAYTNQSTLSSNAKFANNRVNIYA
ncbi:MAG: hypothetical protein LBB88_07090 [Planctomycetaceae bacterium]|jgi:hypothetical protein|nr:hypothetical protein [Planctomycetaceae bacterium]